MVKCFTHLASSPFPDPWAFPQGQHKDNTKPDDIQPERKVKNHGMDHKPVERGVWVGGVAGLCCWAARRGTGAAVGRTQSQEGGGRK